MERTVTEEEIINAIMQAAEVHEDNPYGAVTTRELHEKTGRGQHWLLAQMNKLVDKQIVGVTFVKRKRIDGVRAIIPAYYIKKSTESHPQAQTTQDDTSQ